MNQRVKEVRKALGLSGEKFGESLGLTKMAVSKMETGRVGVSESNVKLICLAYNVNETWLRTGEGQMFNQEDEFLFDIKKQYKLNDFQVDLIKTYLELDDKDKASIDKFITSCRKNPNNKEI